MKAVIYARYSSDNQREESIDGQLRECMEYAKFNGIDVVNSYIDRALSAKTDNRPNFQRMIKDSYKGLFDVVLVWKLDRFARNRYDSAHYKTILKRNGVRVLSAKETISEGAEGILLESMLEGYAEYYSIELAEKVKRGLTENALKAKANGGTCTFGYTVDRDRHYQIDPPAALIVREVFQLYADGKTMKEIKDILNAKSLTNSRGKEFTFNTIQRMLSNRKYIGEYHFGEVTIPDSMPAIVDKELFEKVQKMLVKNKKAPSRHKAEDDYLLTTKLFCGHCGAIMNGESGTSHTNTTYRYYKCVNSRKKKCKKKPITKEKIENAVIKHIMQFLEDEKAIDELVERIYELQFAENTYIPKLEEQIAETQKRIDNLIKAAEQGFVSESSAKRLKELEETKKQQEIALIQEQIKTPLFTTDQIAFAIYKFRQLDLSTREAKQALIDGFVNAIYLYDDHAKLILNYKNDTKTITLDELQGSDFNSVTAPNKKPASAGFLFGEEQITERDLRVEAFARANGLRNNDGNRWQERKLHTTVWCAPGRAAKGANPFLCATNSGGLLPAAVRVVGFERDLRVEAFARANGLRNNDGNRWQERKLCRLLRSPIIQPASPPLPAFYFSKNSLFARASI